MIQDEKHPPQGQAAGGEQDRSLRNDIVIVPATVRQWRQSL